MKYIKKVKIGPNFKIEFEILSQGHRKKFGPKIKKIYFAECYGGHSTKLIFLKKKLPSAGPDTRQRGPLPSARKWHSAKNFFIFFKFFAECHVPWHSAKTSLPSAKGGTRQIIFFVCFWSHFFCGALLQ